MARKFKHVVRFLGPMEVPVEINVDGDLAWIAFGNEGTKFTVDLSVDEARKIAEKILAALDGQEKSGARMKLRFKRFKVRRKGGGQEREAIRLRKAYRLTDTSDDPTLTTKVPAGHFLIIDPKATNADYPESAIVEDVMSPEEFEAAYERAERGD